MAKKKKGETPATETETAGEGDPAEGNGHAEPAQEIVLREQLVKLTEAQLAEAGEKLAAVDLEILEIAQEAKDTAGSFRKVLKEKRARSKELAEQVESGAVKRNVECLVHRDAVTNERWLTRKDTGEEVEGSREIMSAAEIQALRQGDLFTGDEDGEGAEQEPDEGDQDAAQAAQADESTETQPTA